MAPYIQTTTASSSRTNSTRSDHRFKESSQAGYLRPEDAILSSSVPRKPVRQGSPLGRNEPITTTSEARKRRGERRGRSDSRRRKTTWKKLLWVKQSYPDNYTDEETFLDHLQRNPRLQPCEFWPLVADSTIIVQHLCSVIIFICCFTAIFQERVSPQTVVEWATFCTVVGWVLRDFWQGRVDKEALQSQTTNHQLDLQNSSKELNVTLLTPSSSTAAEADFGMPFNESHDSLCTPKVTVFDPSSASLDPGPNGIEGTSSTVSGSAESSAISAGSEMGGAAHSTLSPRMKERLTTIKSAVLIYFFLLGLSPILKSLTKSTSSDSIWALSSWLIGINVFTFDYGAGPDVKFPASLSTNAALMASTVLASRLPSTTHVFSLTLFSIEVFGLFPVFRRHLRHHSWTGHLWLTAILVIVASSGLSMIFSGGGWGMGVLGIVLGTIITFLSMGLTSWWLIGLQRYKNEIHGPWDPARPIIRRHWD